MWPLSGDLTIDHFRMNVGPMQAPCERRCFNPLHLEPVSSIENVRRAAYIREVCPSGHDLTNPANVKLGGPGKTLRRCYPCNKAQRKRGRERSYSEKMKIWRKETGYNARRAATRPSRAKKKEVSV